MISLIGTLIIGLVVGAIAKADCPWKRTRRLSYHHGDRHRRFVRRLLSRADCLDGLPGIRTVCGQSVSSLP